MSPKILRILGFLLILASAVLAVLNLKRVANAGTMWISSPLLVIGMALMLIARQPGSSRNGEEK